MPLITEQLAPGQSLASLLLHLFSWDFMILPCPKLRERFKEKLLQPQPPPSHIHNILSSVALVSSTAQHKQRDAAGKLGRCCWLFSLFSLLLNLYCGENSGKRSKRKAGGVAQL